MALLKNCRFCGSRSVNVDHDDCAKNFGEGLQKKIWSFIQKNPTQKLPKSLVDKLVSRQWEWYQSYLAREKRRKGTAIHMRQIETDTKKLADRILSEKHNATQLKACNKPYDEYRFNVSINVAVKVFQEPQY
jgi:ribosomal protein L37E